MCDVAQVERLENNNFYKKYDSGGVTSSDNFNYFMPVF